ncbi:MAG: hypothetical protein LBG70_03915 [Bifidobacteriaceae bacterium]|jgi:hypothetical protein|nr:hypothetical protein [Bifidobacteriaceae bacterium]
MSEDRQFHRPALFDARLADNLPGEGDPADRAAVAHQTAWALLARARSAAPSDPALVARLINLVQSEGIDLLVQLWAPAAPDSLPGALWRLYLLRELVRGDLTVAARYRLGQSRREVDAVIAGSRDIPGPPEMRDLADSILSGVFVGEFDIALHRAAAFCRIVSVGAALDADLIDSPHQANQAIRQSRQLRNMAVDLAKVAEHWKVGRLV